MIYFLFALAVLYTLLAFVAFNFIPEARKLADFERRKEYFLYFFDYICLFFSLLSIFAAFSSFFNGLFTFQQIISIPLMHLLCDSFLFMCLQPKLSEKNSNNNNDVKSQEIIAKTKKSGIISKIKGILDDPLQIIHHILLISIYLQDEISVPLLLIKKQIQRLKLQPLKRFLFESIEFTFIAVYIISRGLLLPGLGFYWAFAFHKGDFIGFLLVCSMNWINSFWVMQTLCLFYKKTQLKWLRFLENYRKGGMLKGTFHSVLAISLVLIPNYIYIIPKQKYPFS